MPNLPPAGRVLKGNGEGFLLAVPILGFRFLLYPLIEALTDLPAVGLTFIRRGGVLLSALAGYWLSVTVVGRRGFPELRPRPLGILFGALSGALLISTTIATLFAVGVYREEAFRGVAGSVGVGATILVAALLEEILFRGFLFQRLEDDLGSVWALVLVSALFGVLHLFNRGVPTSTALSITLVGALWTAVFIATRNLWAVGLHHFTWNLAIFCSGAPLSGFEAWRSEAPLETAVGGPDWLTGGSFGPENSLVTIGVVAGALAGLLIWAGRKGRLREAGWHQLPPAS